MTKKEADPFETASFFNVSFSDGFREVKRHYFFIVVKTKL
jgi:hypothetical protein